MRDNWRFFSYRWWLTHVLGFSLVYAAARLNSVLWRW